MGILVDAACVSAVAVRRGRIVWAAESHYAEPSELAQVLGALAAERPRGAREASVALAEGVARVKTVEGLPRLKRRDLVAHVRLNSRRYFLQNGVPLVTDAMPLRQAGALLAGAPVPLVEAVVAGLAAAGIACRSITPAELLPTTSVTLPLPEGLSDGARAAFRIASAPPGTLSLMPEQARARQARDRVASIRRWAAAAAAAIVLCAAGWTVGQWRLRTRAEQELEQLKPSLHAALSARRDLEATDHALGLMAAMESGSARRGRFLAELTRALPDSAFVVSLRLDPDGAGSLSGYAPRAAAIVARLERAGLVRRAALEGPVTREVVAGRELERFALRFRSAGPGSAP